MKQYLFCRKLFLASLPLLLFAASCSDSGDGSNRYSDARPLNVKDSILLTNEETFTLKIFYAKGFNNMTSTVFTVEPADYKICKMTNKFCGMAGDSCIVYIELQSGEDFGNTTVKVKFHDILNKAEGGELDFNVVHKEKVVDAFVDNIGGVKIYMQYVEGGTSVLGMPEADSLRLVGTKDAEGDTTLLTPERIHKLYPLTTVKLEDFYMARTEVTCKLYKAVMGTVLHEQDDNERPAMLSLAEGRAFVKKLSELTGRNYRLPSRYEWEYAAKGGKKSKGYIYPGSNNIEDVAWTGNDYGGIRTNKPFFVGQKAPNELGLYDMAGNLAEWVNDSILKLYYKPDGELWLKQYLPVCKGGSNWINTSWCFYPWYIRYIGDWYWYQGIRLVISREDYEMKPVE